MSQEKKGKNQKKREKNNRLHPLKQPNFFEEHGSAIHNISDHILSKVNPKGEVIILSLDDDENFIILDGMYAEVWKKIDGKTPWKEILGSLHPDDALCVHEALSSILKNDDFSAITTTKKTGKKRSYYLGGLEIVMIDIKQEHKTLLSLNSAWDVYGAVDLMDGSYDNP